MQRFTNTFSIKFYCRASRVASDGTAPVELAINLQGERFISHLPRRAKPNEFEKQMHGRRTNDLKEYLSAIELRLRNLETICFKEGEPFTLDVIKRFIKAGYSRETVTLGLLRDEYLVSLRHKLDAGAISEKRYRKYEIAAPRRRVLLFVKDWSLYFCSCYSCRKRQFFFLRQRYRQNAHTMGQEKAVLMC